MCKVLHAVTFTVALAQLVAGLPLAGVQTLPLLHTSNPLDSESVRRQETKAEAADTEATALETEFDAGEAKALRWRRRRDVSEEEDEENSSQESSGSNSKGQGAEDDKEGENNGGEVADARAGVLRGLRFGATRPGATGVRAGGVGAARIGAAGTFAAGSGTSDSVAAAFQSIAAALATKLSLKRTKLEVGISQPSDRNGVNVVLQPSDELTVSLDNFGAKETSFNVTITKHGSEQGGASTAEQFAQKTQMVPKDYVYRQKGTETSEIESSVAPAATEGLKVKEVETTRVKPTEGPKDTGMNFHVTVTKHESEKGSATTTENVTPKVQMEQLEHVHRQESTEVPKVEPTVAPQATEGYQVEKVEGMRVKPSEGPEDTSMSFYVTVTRQESEQKADNITEQFAQKAQVEQTEQVYRQEGTEAPEVEPTVAPEAVEGLDFKQDEPAMAPEAIERLDVEEVEPTMAPEAVEGLHDKEVEGSQVQPTEGHEDTTMSFYVTVTKQESEQEGVNTTGQFAQKAQVEQMEHAYHQEGTETPEVEPTVAAGLEVKDLKGLAVEPNGGTEEPKRSPSHLVKSASGTATKYIVTGGAGGSATVTANFTADATDCYVVRAYVSFPAVDSTGKAGLDPTLQQEYLDHLEQVFCVGPSGLPAEEEAAVNMEPVNMDPVEPADTLPEDSKAEPKV